ncbi:MAG: Stk1 family PASTA domain-containing Ser/Thr kinase [Clostridia bacterium]|nr:Stk1 family PASTA domain-containing Ser/Thr kinase [Clostridia bacterium]
MDKYLGKRLDGRYEIQEIIGVGGMAVVYKAYDNVEDRTVAIKILKDEFLENDDFLRRFKNESKAIAMLSHQNIVQVYDVSFGDLIQYIVMEYIDGITLKEYIENNGSLRWGDAIYYAMQILRALQHAHDKGIVHRDVKPQNIMVLADGTIKVADFGIARFARSNQRTVTDMAIGSVHYISPEQARGEKTDEKSDIYSVGVILYEMLTGKMPFDADSAVSVAIMQLQREPQLPTEINPSIPKGLEQITLKAMQKSPERRYQSAAEMLCDLEEVKKDPSATFNHNYFVDNQPTKFVDEMSSTPASAAYVTDDTPDEDNNDGKNGMIIPILSGIAAAFVIALVVLGIIFLPRLFGKTDAEFTVPTFTGKTVDEVKGDEQLELFEVEWSPEDNPDYADKGVGYIFKQEPAAGRTAKKGEKLVLHYNKASGLITVPALFNETETNAKQQLEAVNLKKIKIEYISGDEVEPGCQVGHVSSTDPAAGTFVTEDTLITVYVYLENSADYINVPSVLSYTSDYAKNKIESLGLRCEAIKVNLRANNESIYKYPSSSSTTTSEGYVFAQDPKIDSSVLPDTTIKIYVSTGLYEYDVKIAAPKDFITQSGTFSLRIKGENRTVESGKIDFSSNDSYTFEKLTTNERTVTVQVSIKADNESGQYYDYLEAEFDTYKGKFIGTPVYASFESLNPGSGGDN